MKVKQRSIYVSCYQTQFGVGAVAATEAGAREIWFPQACQTQIEKNVSLSYPEATMTGNHHSLSLAKQLEDYFNGALKEFDFQADHTGLTPFTVKVLKAARSIPNGETRTYGWLAEQAGSPKAFRAAGQVMANNRLPIVIPCHRILGHSKRLGGFSGGLEMKIKLLEIEGHDVSCWSSRRAA